MTEATISKTTQFFNGLIMTLSLIIFYAIAIGIWGAAIHKSYLWFAFFGAGFGLLLGLIAGPIVAHQKTHERAREMISAVSSLWEGIALITGILGLIVWAIRVMFFR